MIARLEVLVYAGATTSFIADERYRTQAKACLEFVAEQRHALDDIEAVCTPPQNCSGVKVITPSTTKSDASDVVKDSQRNHNLYIGTKRRDRATFGEEQIPPSTTHITSDQAGRPDLLQVIQLSARQFAEHEKSHLITSTRALTDPSTEPRLHTDISRLLNMSNSMATRAPARASQEPAVTAYESYMADMKGASTLAMTALDALKFREAQALKLRLSQQSGLQFAKTVLSPEIATPAHLTDHLVAGETVPSFKIPATPVPASIANPEIDVETPINRKFLRPGAIIDDSPDPIRPTCVDRYIIIATDDKHGIPRSPSVTARTTNTSDRSDRQTIEPDILSISTTLSPANRKRARSVSPSFGVSRRTPLIPRRYRTPPSTSMLQQHSVAKEDPRSAQSQILFAVSSPAEVTFISSSARTRQLQKPPACAMENVPSRSVYSDFSLAQILGTGCHDHRSALSFTKQAENQAVDVNFVLNHTPYKPADSLTEISESIHATTNSRHKTGNAKSMEGRDERSILSEITDSKHINSQRDEERVHDPSTKSQTADSSQKIYEPPEKDTSDRLGGYATFSMPNTIVNNAAPLMPKYLADTKTVPKIRTSRRELRPLERGYWLIDLAKLNFHLEEADALWSGLSAIIRGRELYWLTLQAVRNSIRIYCHGICVMEVWVVIYALSRKTKRGLTWHDATGTPIIFQ